ncbi:PARP10_14_15 [Acanthosepion pharaonis]|uniref:Poly [ADP-ribose] polymerase n=1 Tax=Acanthosepion pharaonis TaxID=158019 RepID=A0A812ASJ8_ACAPH|nr:PARP10_14_15 [Sepia pharaonis]
MGQETSSLTEPHVIHEGPPKIVVAYLENFNEAGIIVNSTDKSLQLSYGGQISKTILNIAGQGIQTEINAKYPNGIKPGDVAVTDGYNLPYKYVFHCSLQGINQRVSHHEIREVVNECLQTAVKTNKNATIAFPCIGTGAMNFPPRILKTIYCTVLEFMLGNSSLNQAYILIHPSKTDLREYAKKIDHEEERKRLTYKVKFPKWSQTEKIQRVKLSEEDEDYIMVKEKFHCSINNANIKKIERIENKRLFVAYERYKNNIQNGKTTERKLWHGTSHECIDSIIRYGFDWRLAQRKVYGQGCYFAVNANYSNQDTYAAPNRNGEKCMFLAFVVAGTACSGNPNFTEFNIPNDIQSTTNNEKSPTIFVTYNDDQMYPAFVVVYEREQTNSNCIIL